MQMTKFFKQLTAPVVVSALAALVSLSCSEGEHDYYYRVANNTEKTVTLNFKLDGDPVAYFDTIQPGDTHTLARRGGVTGEDIWDVETAAEIYQFSALEACLDGSSFTENLRLRSLWGGVQEKDGNGIYTLSLKPDMFTMKDHMYWYWIYNNTGYTFRFNVGPAPFEVAAGAPFVLAFPNRSRYVTDIYGTDANARITQFSISSVMWISATDTVYTNNFNANRRSEWTFETAVNPALYGTEDTVGIYTLTLTNEIFE